MFNERISFVFFRPRWVLPGIVFLRFFASLNHLQLLSEDDFRKLMREIPMALNAVSDNIKTQQSSPTNKGKYSLLKTNQLTLLLLFIQT